ncbi:hypothetical protein CQ040_20005 [Microbacterium sp. MYb54]|nr:hypothetical protein CQ040_20005 [Microbacterium sp. MYb54]PRB20972.1 hypothetical protein CQ037_19550 [Microbacterium sp. MYb50]PRB58955.1 hypothetical protein CQ021_19775 [Microbacterium sp. MYb24]
MEQRRDLTPTLPFRSHFLPPTPVPVALPAARSRSCRPLPFRSHFLPRTPVPVALPAARFALVRQELRPEPVDV